MAAATRECTSGTACKVQGCFEGDDCRQLSTPLSNRRELERTAELVNATDDDRVGNAARVPRRSKSFGVADEKSTRGIKTAPAATRYRNIHVEWKRAEFMSVL